MVWDETPYMESNIAPKLSRFKSRTVFAMPDNGKKLCRDLWKEAAVLRYNEVCCYLHQLPWLNRGMTAESLAASETG
jgi:hypothetical protein